MRNLLLSSFLAIVLFGCTLGHYNQLKSVPPLPSQEAPQELRPVFGDHFNSFLFKTNISVYGNDFSGLLITKQMQSNDYRVIFTTELGMKLFDFEFADSAFTLHYCVPQFNRPALLKTIQQDIETLLMNKINYSQVTYFTNKPSRNSIKPIIYRIGKISSGKFSDYYFSSGNRLVKIEHAKRQVKKTTFTLDNYQDDIPGYIRIQHHNIRLKIELTLLKK
jgi:hypothetical protein